MGCSGYIQLLRPLQWLKNVFVVAPLFFSTNLLNVELLWSVMLTFAAFCLASSSVYCFNDIIDREADRLHPRKCHRPVASGRVTVRQAYAVMSLCIALSYVFAVLSTPSSSFFITIYLLLNLAYSLRLKRYAIVDVMVIAAGFVVRVLSGGAAAAVPVSGWIVLMTFLLTLFLALAKRSDDYRIYEKTGTVPRVSIVGYNQTFINEAVAIAGAVTMVCYIMYTMSEEVIQRMGTRYVYLTSFWVLAALLRYLQNMIVFGRSGSPTKALVKDYFLQFIIAGWILSFFFIIYSI